MINNAAIVLYLFFAVVCTGGSQAGAAPADPTTDCSAWTLDGYRLGMRGDELLAIRSVTLHVEGQAQVVVPEKFQGVLVLDALNRLEKWDARYQTTDGEALRSELRDRFGAPVSDVSGSIVQNESGTVRQRRTIWRSLSCDTAIVIYENSGIAGTKGRTVSGTLARASSFPPGFVEMKTLLPAR